MRYVGTVRPSLISTEGSVDRWTLCSTPKHHWASRALAPGCPSPSRHHGWQLIGSTAGVGKWLLITTPR